MQFYFYLGSCDSSCDVKVVTRSASRELEYRLTMTVNTLCASTQEQEKSSRNEECRRTCKRGTTPSKGA